MTKTGRISEAQTQLQGLLALARNGDKVIIEENRKYDFGQRRREFCQVSSEFVVVKFHIRRI